jgi:hypothetical protein
MGLLRAVLEVYTTANLWSDMAYAVAAGGIAVGGSLVLVSLFWVLEYFVLRRQRRNQFIRVDKANHWQQRRFHCGGNILQAILKFAFILGLGLIIWVAGAVAGFNPYSTATAMLVMGVVITYMFAGPLGAWGTSLALVWDNQLYIGQHWEFHGAGPGWDGVISGIYTFEVEMMHRDPESGNVQIISVPIANFFNAMRKCDLVKQSQAKKEEWARPAYEGKMAELASKKEDYHDDKSAFHQPVFAARPLEVQVAMNPSRQRRGAGPYPQQHLFHSTAAPELHVI